MKVKGRRGREGEYHRGPEAQKQGDFEAAVWLDCGVPKNAEQ